MHRLKTTHSNGPSQHSPSTQTTHSLQSDVVGNETARTSKLSINRSKTTKVSSIQDLPVNEGRKVTTEHIDSTFFTPSIENPLFDTQQENLSLMTGSEWNVDAERNLQLLLIQVFLAQLIDDKLTSTLLISIIGIVF
jgi:hypothetical protein